jgi:hypothetical protein
MSEVEIQKKKNRAGNMNLTLSDIYTVPPVINKYPSTQLIA